MSIKRSDKLDFSVELGFITLVSGALLSQLTYWLLSSAYYLNFIAFMRGVFSHIFHGMLGTLLLILLLRMMISIIDKTHLNSRWQLRLSSVIGAFIVVGVLHLHIDIVALLTYHQWPEVVVYTLGYTIPLILWNEHRNIWRSSIRLPKSSDDSLLDENEI